MRSIEEIEINGEKLGDILEEHKLWLAGVVNQKIANLRGANLSEANLRGANLRGANLSEANLREVNLRWANLRGVNLREVNLRWADLRGANLRGVNLDYSCWPLWCGSKGVKIDRKQFAQLAAHLCVVDVDDDECKAVQRSLLDVAKTSHRANDLGL